MNARNTHRSFEFLTEDRELRRQRLATMPSSRQLWHVVILSAIGLFCELLLIRWLDAEIRALAYVKNLALIGSFLGLGIGFAIAGRKRSTFPVVVLLLALVFAVGLGFAGQETLAGPAGPEANLGIGPTGDTGQLIVFYLLIASVFGLVVLAMVPLGQIAGEFMEGLPSLPCYTANVGGALAGILLFFAFAVLSIPPWVAATLVFAVCLAYLRRSRLWWLSAAVALLTSIGMASVDYGTERTVWSPYNKIKVREFPPIEIAGGEEIRFGWVLEVQNGYYQRLLDLRPATVAAVAEQVPIVDRAARAYNYPYFWSQPGKVLVVGAGTGNDVAAALRNGAEHVDAVEIDPVILRFGHRHHPEKPYGDPRVRVIEADARQYLKGTDERYDLIVFGLLDSHTSFYSALSSNIRLDNYVYTVEALQEALGRLTEDGVLSLAFYAEQPWIVTRLDQMLREATGRRPLVLAINYDGGWLYLVGPGVPDTATRPEVTLGVPDEVIAQNPPGPSATDDWPFLYLERRGVPATVLRASAGMLAVTLLLVWIFFRGKVTFDRHLFLLGAGFLLVETRTIAQLGLLFGSTWRVSAITIAVILALILVANRVIARVGPLPRLPLYAGLGVFLVANYLVAPGIALGSGPLAGGLLALFYLMPLAFAALIFASSITETAGLATPLASNLIGSVLGGLLENLSMAMGISALSLVALAIYAGSFRK